MRIAHLALDFGLGRQCRHRVDDDDVDRARTHEHVGDLQRLLARVRLRDQQFVDVDAQLFGIGRVERVFGIDERSRAARLLGFRNNLQGQRRLAR